MSEIADFALLVLLVAGALVLAILSTRVADRLPVPAPVLFLVAAAVASDLWPDLGSALSMRTVERIAVVALVVILLNGGLDIGWSRLRTSVGPVLSIGVIGTFVTCGIVAVAAHVLLGLSWTLAGIVGAALAPTDPAVVFSVLGRREIAGRSGTVLEGEAGVNDPAGIALMLGMIEVATHHDASVLVILREFALAMGLGLAFGWVASNALIPGLRRLRLSSEGLHPVLVLLLALVLYAVTSLVDGSGFLAVFVMGLLLADASVPYKPQIERFSGALASLAEIVVFIALGLTIELSAIPATTWLHGVLLALVLAAVARPLTVALTLTPFALSRPELGFLTWSGLKGAVPILLAAFATLSGVTGAESVYALVFVVVLVSVTIQGGLVPRVARALGIGMRERAAMPWQLSVPLEAEPGDLLELTVPRRSPAHGRPLSALGLGAGEWISTVIRDGRSLQPVPELELRAGDRVYLHADPARHATLEDRIAHSG
ncbi:MAG: potassium/hydrogen antiporter [Solirubrobacteraceae bacterium]|jgi:cell volume regulation protein A|nr:potassium/hydrogen antiporter [Solirubrobacteraceae bacterium]